ncbi:MAG: AAA domain-containing protein, partial [Frankia sp.]
MIEDYEKVKARSLHLLDYLTALAAERTTKPKRALSEYNPPLIRPADVPRHAGVLVGAAAAPSAWLRVRKVEEPPPPTLPAGFDSYLGSTAVLGGTAVDAAAPPTLPPDFDETCARHNKDPAPLRAEFAAWMEQQWEPWAELARPARAARVLYQRLYDLRLQLARDNATHELVWGHGELIWALGGQTIDHPLVITPVAIEMDTDTGVLTLVPDGLPAVETDPLHGLGLAALEELTALRDRVRASPPDPWSAGGLAEVFDQAVAPLGLDARVLAGDPKGDEVPVPAAVRAPAAPAAAAVLVDTWVVFVRPRPALYQRFYSELRQVLAGRDELPEALAAIVTEGNDGRAGDDPADAGRAGRVSWADNLGQRLLMPLASNDEQERIAVQLARARGVTVQGPPGTGKSHTIANLVSHLVAHGQRVLVTAHNEQALSVLRGKIPIELRDLSVAVLGSSSAALGELRASVQMIMDAVSSIDEGPETAAVEALIAQLDAARAQERHLELRLVSLLADEAAQFPLADGAPLNDGAPLAGGSAKAADVASWLAAHEARWDRIPDRLRPDQRPGLTTAELDELIRLAALTRDDMRTAQLDLPEPRDLPSAAALSEHFRRLDRLRDDLADLETQGVTLAAVDALGAEAWSRLLADVDTAAHVTAAREPWVATVGEQVAESAALAGFWAEQTNQLGDTARTIIELRRVTFGRAVVVPDGDPRVQQEWLDELADRFAAGRGVPRLGHKDLRAFHAAIRVDDLEPRTVGDIDVVRATIRERVATAAAGRRYEEIVALVGAPPLPVNAPAFLPTLEANVTRLSEAITWETTDRTATVARLSAVLPDTPARPTSAQWTTAATILAGATRRHQERELTAKLDALGTFLDDGAGTPRASPLWGVLRDGLERRDLDTWRSALDEAVRLAALRPALDRRDELARRVGARAPRGARPRNDPRGPPAGWAARRRARPRAPPRAAAHRTRARRRRGPAAARQRPGRRSRR